MSFLFDINQLLLVTIDFVNFGSQAMLLLVAERTEERSHRNVSGASLHSP